MILNFANGEIPAYIDSMFNFTPVDSLVEGLIAVRDKARRGERYLLGGENTPMKDLLGKIEALSGRPAPKLKMPYGVALAAGLIDTKLLAPLTGKPPAAPLTGVRLAGRRVSFSSEKAWCDLGWRAGPLEPALKKMLDWLAARGLLKDN
jgi:dihydroflavonol-4-reductase